MDGQRLEAMIRRTIQAIRASEELLRRTKILVERSEQICRTGAKLPHNEIDQSIR